MKTKKRFFLLALCALFFANVHNVDAQVTIGAEKEPESFSALEIVSTSGGFRLPQLNATQRATLTSELQALTDADKIAATKGLMIFNTTENYPETWSGTEWIAQRPVRMERKGISEPFRIPAVVWKKLFGDFDTSIGGLYTFHMVLGADFTGETSSWANTIHGVAFRLIVNGAAVDQELMVTQCGSGDAKILSFLGTLSGQVPQNATVEIQVAKAASSLIETPVVVNFTSVLCIKQ